MMNVWYFMFRFWMLTTIKQILLSFHFKRFSLPFQVIWFYLEIWWCNYFGLICLILKDWNDWKTLRQITLFFCAEISGTQMSSRRLLCSEDEVRSFFFILFSFSLSRWSCSLLQVKFLELPCCRTVAELELTATWSETSFL